MQALRLAAQERLDPLQMTGSWAGAMGQVQFMPTTFIRFAVDGDGDGHRDIWRSTPDALASVAIIWSQKAGNRAKDGAGASNFPRNCPMA